MIKNTKKIIALLLISLLLTGCVDKNAQQISQQHSRIASLGEEIEVLNEEVNQLKIQKEELTKTVNDTKKELGIERYIITLNISQSHFTLDIGKHIKDAMNDIELQLPVDKEFYDNVEVGDMLDNSFRTGSLLMEGSFGKWEVEIVDKEIKN